MTCDHAQQLIQRAFVWSDAAALQRVREHLASCEGCQSTYDRLFEGQAALARTGDGESPRLLAGPERELLRQLVLPREQPSRMRFWLPTVGTVAAVVGTLTAVLLWLPSGEEEQRSRQMVARGAADAAAHQAAAAPLGIRALCISEAGAAPRVRSLVGGRCNSSDALGFTYRNATGESWQLQVLVVNAAGKIVAAGEGAQSAASAPPTGGDDSFAQRHAMVADEQVGVVDQQDGVLGDQPHEHDHADHREDIQRPAGQG